jgi:hypothetical protein
MIKLKNITKIGNIVYADVYSVEAHPIHFEIAVDIYDKKLERFLKIKTLNERRSSIHENHIHHQNSNSQNYKA